MQARPGAARTSRQRRDGGLLFVRFFFQRSTDTSRKVKEQRMSSFIVDMTSSRHVSAPQRCVNVTRQATQGVRTNKHRSCHLSHQTYGTMTADIIDTSRTPTKPQIYPGALRSTCHICLLQSKRLVHTVHTPAFP